MLWLEQAGKLIFPMKEIHMNSGDKPEIAQALKDQYAKLLDWLERSDAERLTNGPEDKWNAGQHFDHLLRSTRPLNSALRLPKIAPRLLFGKSNREGRTYEQLIERYHQKLSDGGAASGRYVPSQKKQPTKDYYRKQMAKERDRLVAVLDKWKESELDSHLLPHPLLGKLTIREMYFFSIYHAGHHCRVLEKDY